MMIYQSWSMLRLIALTILLVFASNSAIADGSSHKRVFVVFADNANKDIDNNGFLQSAREGMAEARGKLGVEIKEFIQKDNEDPDELYTRLAQEKPDMVVGVGIFHVRPTLNVAEKFPDIKFTVIDGIVPPLFPNGQSVIFKNYEGAFLVGVAAGFSTKTGKVSFIGGRDTPITQGFLHGFEQGVHYANPDVEVISNMIGKGMDSWDNPDAAYKIALQQIADGADVIFTAAGASGRGGMKAAKEKHVYSIGVDVNQNGIYPGSVLTSMTKRVDVAVFNAIKSMVDGSWSSGIKYLGVADGALDYAVDANNKSILPQDVRLKISHAKDMIASGDLKVEP